MNRIATALSIAAAFAAGCGATHLLRPALAAESIEAVGLTTAASALIASQRVARTRAR